VVIERPAPLPHVVRDRKLVLRAASLSPRDQYQFVDVARRLPDFKFVMCLAENRHVGAQDTIDAVFNANVPPLPNLEVLWNVSPQDMAIWYARAGIYLHTFPRDKTAAMPVSIAQSLAAGCYTIVRNQPRLAAMIGNAGASYETYDQVVALIDATRDWDDAEWTRQADASRAEGERYCADHSIRAMVNDWRTML
jgi:glycosyltransferase involved in cell wall biosynthesis